MEQLREKMMNQKSVAGVQKYMHQFNKGTRKDKNGKGTGNHKMILCSRKWRIALGILIVV